MKHIYAMQRRDGAIKIGMSSDPETRKVSVGYEVRQPVDVKFFTPARSDARKVEEIAHKILLDKRETGEWFMVTVEEAMNAIAQAVEIVEGRAPDVTASMKRIPSGNFYRALSDGMEARNYRFPKFQLAELEKVSKKRGIKEPELMRRALEDFLLKCKNEETPE